MSNPKKRSYEYYQGKTAKDVDYAEFIGQLALDHVGLHSTTVRLLEGGAGSKIADVILKHSARWDGMDPAYFENRKYLGDGFDVYHQTIAIALNERRLRVARIEVEFELNYMSFIPMDEETLEIFSETTVQLNVWPYLREFLDSMLSRLAIGGYTLPSKSSVSQSDYGVSDPFANDLD